jgi:cyclic lactone autoinducer peptide
MKFKVLKVIACLALIIGNIGATTQSLWTFFEPTMPDEMK